MTDLPVPIRLLHPDAIIPAYVHPGDAGADLCSTEAVSLAPGERRLVRTGIAVQIPDGYAGFVTPRSGLAHRLGLSVLNTPGTIDSGYRGELQVNLHNADPAEVVTLDKGDRIAQLIIVPVAHAKFSVVDALASSDRAEGGHGSTGLGSVAGADPKEQQ
ncbi:dUTP diphosphatase [Epidermidibacterium keratini]|uniref:dUTP diphosphatase n=1 Tax=Epidermidibacterium keratini TaxID=1891644 RepID=UPI001CEF5DE2|nr:dUTP diphosphatase [Epidermidibacterium keratini]